jgi:hypothetical protein
VAHSLIHRSMVLVLAIVWKVTYMDWRSGLEDPSAVMEVYNLPLAFAVSMLVHVVVSLITGGRRGAEVA